MFKHVWHLAFIALCTAASAAQLDSPPDLTEARVTIPYSELKDLWLAAQTGKTVEKPRPPVEASLLSAHYELTFTASQAEGSVVYEAQSFNADWTIIPLLGAEAQIESVTPPDAQIILRDGRYALVTHGVGKQTLKIQFATKLAESPGGAHLHLAVCAASINTLSVDGIPENEVAGISGATQIASEKNKASFRLPALDTIDVVLASKRSIAPPTPSAWKIEPRIFVRLAEGRLNYEARIAASADNGSGLSMDLALPAGANISKMSSADLAESQVTTGDDRNRVAHLRWNTRDILRREIEVDYDLPEPPTPGQWKLESPRLAEGGESSPSLYVLVPEPGLELIASAPAATPRELPRWLTESAAGKNFLVFTGDAPLQAKWLPVVQTARAVAEHEEARMRVVADGALLTETAYSIRHDGALAWKLDIPPDSELLACSVDGNAVNPVNRGDHLIEFWLPPGKTLTEVKVSYTGRKPAFKPVSGQLAIELPETDLLVNEIDWKLQIPAAYEVAAFEGNVEAARNGDASSSISLRKELCKGERPSAELFYQKPHTNQ